MKDLIKDRKFIIMFLLTYFSFFVITVGILDLKSAGFGLGSADHGFPFTYYHSNCFGGNYSFSGLLGNIFVAIIFSFILGLIFKFVWSKITARKLT